MNSAVIEGKDLAMTRISSHLSSPAYEAYRWAESIIDIASFHDLEARRYVMRDQFVRKYRMDLIHYRSISPHLNRLIQAMQDGDGEWRVTGFEHERDFESHLSTQQRTLVKVYLSTEGQGFTKNICTGIFCFQVEGSKELFRVKKLSWIVGIMEGVILVKYELNEKSRE